MIKTGRVWLNTECLTADMDLSQELEYWIDRHCAAGTRVSAIRIAQPCQYTDGLTGRSVLAYYAEAEYEVAE